MKDGSQPCGCRHEQAYDQVCVEFRCDECVLKVQPTVSQRKPGLVGGLLGAQQQAVPMDLRRSSDEFHKKIHFFWTGDPASHVLGNCIVWLCINTDRDDIGGSCHGRCTVVITMGDSAHNTCGP